MPFLHKLILSPRARVGFLLVLIGLCCIAGFLKWGNIPLSENAVNEAPISAHRNFEPSLDPLSHSLPSSSKVVPDFEEEQPDILATSGEFWCQSEYRDLSNSPIFSNFQTWIEEFESLNTFENQDQTEHNLQVIGQLLDQGEQLVKRRAEILRKVIRGDPRNAILLGINEQTISKLPSRIREHMETWESQLVDVIALHQCYDANHPGGFVQRWATFSDGSKKRAWVYGKRKNLPSIRGISAWGISLGDDFAISDLPVRETSDESGNPVLQLGGNLLSVSHPAQSHFFKQQVQEAERRAFIHQDAVYYPMVAGSDGLEEYYEKKYELIDKPKTWSEAKQFAEDKNGTIVIINNKQENDMIRYLLDPDQSNLVGYDDNGTEVNYAWIGASDYEDENSTIYRAATDRFTTFSLFASEGNWKWLDGSSVYTNSNSYTNWLGSTTPFSNSTEKSSQDYAAMDFSTTLGSWVDVNESYRLPFIIEKTLEINLAPVSTKIKGIRKVLVVPARFRDESFDYYGSSMPLVNEFGDPIFEDIQQDAYEPVSQSNIAMAMEEVKEFFLRNSDESFQLEAVISPTVTIPFNKYVRTVGGNQGANLYDSSGQLFGFAILNHSSEVDLAEAAVEAAALQDEGLDWDGPAFQGITEVVVKVKEPVDYSNATFTSPPSIAFSGGGEDPADEYRVRQKFSPAQAEAVLDGEGKIVAIKITDTGAYYFSEPELLVNGKNLQNYYDFNLTLEGVCLSWVGITSSNEIGAAGVGLVGFPGSHVDATDGRVSSTTIAHELGHNFGLWHANRFESSSERPNSDESRRVDYGNPYSLMGTASIIDGGDLTVTEKVFLKNLGHFGLTHGDSVGVDVFTALDKSVLDNSLMMEPASAEVPSNTFRIYRHDHKSAPLALRTGSFSGFVPESIMRSSLLTPNQTYNLSFVGTGEGAAGSFQVISMTSTPTERNAILTISTPGIGYTDEPRVLVVDEQNTTLLSLDSNWIREKAGTANYSQAELRNKDENTTRGIRGMHVKASDFTPSGPDTGFALDGYWLSYRREASEYGLSVINGSVQSGENYLLDMNLMTPQDITDAFLLLGNTFSDYDSDVHLTPIKQGGTYPAQYLDVVINMGTVQSGNSTAPSFSLSVSNDKPSVGEFIQISAQVTDNNASGYAYSWFTGKVAESNPLFLNQPSILKSFSQSGQYVVRVVVSDLKGGISSRNIAIQVGDYENSKLSSMSGTVRSNQGFTEGARVTLSPAVRIDHTVGVNGNVNDRLLPNGTNNPSAFVIDGSKAPTLYLQRGEIHRFYFDSTANGFPLRFLEHPEHENPRVRLKMLSTPIVDNLGAEYAIPPEVQVVQTTGFDSYFPDPDGPAIVGTYNDFKEGKLDSSADPTLYSLITRPFAKSLLKDTYVEKIDPSPSTRDIEGNYIKFGGKGHHRDYPPKVEVKRSSVWENYSDTNATARAYVDGVGTISPVISLNPGGLENQDFLGPIWETRSLTDPIPDLVIWGTGGAEKRPYKQAIDRNESNASVQIYVDTQKPFIPYRQIAIADQGKNFEPDATMAVLQYPLDPLAYWTFDRHESLFEDNASARYQPSPAWNALQKNSAAGIFPFDGKLLDYWDFEFDSNTTTGADLNQSTSYKGRTVIQHDFNASDENRSDWGLKGKAVYFDGDDNISIGQNISSGSPYTLSMWIKPEDDFAFKIGTGATQVLDYNHSTKIFTFDGKDRNRSASPYSWHHVGIVSTGSKCTLIIDGNATESWTSTLIISDLNSTNFKGLIDETHTFSAALSIAQMKILAGRIFLDLSGNKVHAAPVGDAFPMIDANDNQTGVLVPGSEGLPDVNLRTDSTISNSYPRPKVLGDSWGGEGHGRCLHFSNIGGTIDPNDVQTSNWYHADAHKEYCVNIDCNHSYIDLSPHAFFFAGENEGSISFWINTDGTSVDGSPVDQTVFTAQCMDDNRSFFRLMVRDIGVMQLHAENDGNQIAKFYTGTEGKVTNDGWKHVVFVAAGNGGSSFWVDGVQTTSKFYAGGDNDGGGNSGGNRAFFSDIENLDFIGIGTPFWNSDNNKSEGFIGFIDDFYIYDRPLTGEEINYLYDLRMGREQLPRLEAVVDAVGTVEVITEGKGYKETPDIVFNYPDGSVNAVDIQEVANYLALPTDFNSSDAGKIRFVTGERKVYTWHHVRDHSDWRYGPIAGSTENNNGWIEYQLPYAQPLLFVPLSPNVELQGSVDKIVWTKDMGELVPVVLPDKRTVFRRFIDYVVAGDGRFPSPNNEGYGIPNGLFGFTSPPLLVVGASPGPRLSDDATAHTLFFADLNHSAQIVNPGIGLDPAGFDGSGDVRISGKGYRPNQYEIINGVARISSYSEYWGKNKNALIGGYDSNYTYDTTAHGGDYNQSANWTGLDGHESPNAGELFRLSTSENQQTYYDSSTQSYISSPISYSQGNLLFQDWDHQPGIGEPRNINMEFNQTISHVTMENAGLGYSMPTEIISYGGYPSKNQLVLWATSGHVGPWPFTPAQFRVKSIDDTNGSIKEIEVVDGTGMGYYLAPSLLVSGGGGQGAYARVSSVDASFNFEVNGTKFDINSTKSFVERLYLQNDNATAASNIAIVMPLVEAGSSRRVQPYSVGIYYNASHTLQNLKDALSTSNILTNGGTVTITGDPTQTLFDLNQIICPSVIPRFLKITGVSVTEGGLGYFNIDSNNTPSAAYNNQSPVAGEQDANLSVRLGGYLGEIERCSACKSGDHATKNLVNGAKREDKFYHHLDAWVEIWDRNRSEEIIDQNDDRALASAKIRNGMIEKIIMIKSGRGYIDPVAFVRGISPHHNYYTLGRASLSPLDVHRVYGVWGDSSKEKIPSTLINRRWRCVNQRENRVGEFEDCGHIFQGQYPPEECPGEEDDSYTLTTETTKEATEAWWTRHLKSGVLTHYHNKTLTTDNKFHLCDEYDGEYDNSTHRNAGFRSRRCTGKKENFVLLNDYYRTPYENWQPLDANLSVILEGGKINEIVVENGGSMYLSSEVYFDGSGVDVEAIPIYDERGENVRIIFDDPKLKNLENQYQVTIESYRQLKENQQDRVHLDPNVFLPSGAGQGFIERPWSWDWNSTYDPSYGPREKVLPLTLKSEEVGSFYTEDAIAWNFGRLDTPSKNYLLAPLVDYGGDRILKIEVLDSGVYDDGKKSVTQSGSHSFTVNGANYGVIKLKKTWTEAAQWAVANGGKLAIIEDEFEQKNIVNALSEASINPYETIASDGGGGGYLWIGGNDILTDGSWIWDGNGDYTGTAFWNGNVNGALVTGYYANWGGTETGGVFVPKEPDNYDNNQHGLAISLNGWPLGSVGQWNDLYTGNTLYFLVEYGTNPIVLPPESNLSLGNVLIDFNSSHLPQLASSPSFIPASATAHFSDSLIKFELDQDATYYYGLESDASTIRQRSLFVEEPTVNILPHLPRSVDGVLVPQVQSGMLNETKSSYIYLNGEIGFDSSSTENSYIDLFVDNRLPSKFFYGFGSNADGLPAMGGEIIVSDGLPGMNWGVNEPLDRNISGYTDQNGYFFIPNLEPGLYNVAVFMEDRKFQELTFRPDSNLSRVSDVLYVPGFSDLVMETDNRGAGKSRLVWSSESRGKSRPHPDNMVAPNPTNEFEYEQKILEGIGGGFKQGVTPELIFIPDPSNLSGAMPNVQTTVLVDGSLKLTIVDDENTTAFNPGDRFTVSYSSNVQGVDFREYFQFSESNESSWQGTADSATNGTAWLEIYPNDAEGLGILEIPVSTSKTGNNPFQFTARAYDSNGTELDTSGVNWNLTYDFNSSQVKSLDSTLSEADALAMVATLDKNMSSVTNLTLTSTLRSSGIVGFEVMNAGTGYLNGDSVLVTSEGTGFMGIVKATDGNVTGVTVLEPGRGYSVKDRVSVTSDSGNGVNLRPILGGKLYLDANLTIAGGEILTARTQVTASTRNELNATETWLDYYFDTIMERNETWWYSDLDADDLNNSDERTLGTHPANSDTDGDKLSDGDEINEFNTNPHQSDTDSDGLDDFAETYGDDYNNSASTDPLMYSNDYPQGTDPRRADTDRDGIDDGLEVEIYKADNYTGLSPVIPNTQGKSLGGFVYNMNNYTGNLYLKMELITLQESESPYEVEENNVSWSQQIGAMPLLYSYRNLPADKYYRVSAFIDTYPTSGGNKKYDKGEPAAFWQGLLTSNNFSANLFLVEAPPEIKFNNSSDSQIILPDASSTFTFPLSVTASDLLDGTWGLEKVNPFIAIDGNLSSYLINADSLGESLGKPLNLTQMVGDVNRSIPLGSYSLFYQAIDSSGSKSSKLEQVIIIEDKTGPVISLLGEIPTQWPLGSSWVEPGYLATDNRDQSVNVNVIGTVNVDQIGQYSLLYTATDAAGNSAQSVERIVQVRDSDAPVITLSKVSPYVLTRGHAFVSPSYTAIDLQDGDVTAKVQVTGVSLVDVQVVGDYPVVFSATDSSGNKAEETFIVRIEPPAFSLSGKAIDGYLVGAKVMFDSNGDGVSDIGAENFTDESGAFSLSITNDEFLKFDLNGNGNLDPNEGRIIVSNGVDSSTGAPFGGTIFADPNSTVVTPLTSLVSGLISQGNTKVASLQKIAQAMNLKVDLDLTSYDPLEQAAAGDLAAKNILIEGARISNLLKQTEAFVALKMGVNYSSGQASRLMIESFSQSLNQATPVNPLASSSALSSALSNVLNSVVGSTQYSADDLAACADMIQSSDSLHVNLSNQDLVPLAFAGELTKQQLAVEQTILDSYDELAIGAGDLKTLAASITTTSLAQSSSGFGAVNLFAPYASDFSYIFRKLNVPASTEMWALNVSDLDGDKVTASIQSGNVDTDGDGKNFLGLSADYRMTVDDPEEIRNLFGKNLSVLILLDDGQGKTSTTRATIKVDNELTFLSTSSVVDTWMNSSWFGDFHATGSPWIYHTRYKWLYVHSDGVGGYWFWDPILYKWWWTNQSTYPYAYSHGDQSWLYFQVASLTTSVYDFKKMLWSIRE